MFGRRRRAARAAEAHEAELRGLELRPPHPEASAALIPGPQRIDLTSGDVTALLHRQLTDLIGTDGVWTLVPRRSDDTEVFFHDLKSLEIARTLSSALCQASQAPTTATLDAQPATATPSAVRPRTPDPAPAAVEQVSTSTLTTPITEPAEPTALPWTPRPVAHWADPAPSAAPPASSPPTSSPSTSSLPTSAPRTPSRTAVSDESVSKG